MPREHPYDEAASEIVTWLDEAPSYYAEAMKGGHDAPFSAKTTEQQKLEYYKRQVFRPSWTVRRTTRSRTPRVGRC